jgi:hypothetical protein
MATSVFENEKKLRQGTKFEKKETKGDQLRAELKKQLNKLEKKSFENPMKMERRKENLRSRYEKLGGTAKFMDELKMAKGGRATLKGGGICKKGMNKKAIGRNS